jgi:hypothetical protein
MLDADLKSLLQQTSGLGDSCSGFPPQGAGSSSKPVNEGDLQCLAFKEGRLHLAKTKRLEVPGGSLKSQGELK